MIRFLCEDCGRRISVSDDIAGRSAKCPGCGSAVVVAVAAVAGDVGGGIELDFREIPSFEEVGNGESPQGVSQEFFNDLGLKPIGMVNLDAGKRTKPWYIDIFLYPISTSGIINFLMLVLLPPFFSLLAKLFFIIPVLSIFAFVFMMFKFIFCAYFFWYIAECVRGSCLGLTRAPSVYNSGGEDFWSVLNIYFSIFMCHFVCFAPAPVSLLYNYEFGIVYWGLVAAGCMVFPILYLSIVVIDSMSAWSPFTLIIAMAKLMPQYLIFPAVMFSFIWGMHTLVVWLVANGCEGFLLVLMLSYVEPFVIAIVVYLSFVAAHLLGRFYWKNAHRLDW